MNKLIKKLFKLKCFSMVALVCCGCMLMSSAAYSYSVKFETVDYFAWGRLYNPATGATANANPYYGSMGQDLLLDTYTAADGSEDAFGITQIQKIADISGTNVIWEKSASQELTAFFYGADDVYLSSVGVGGTSMLASSGFTIEMWLDNTPDYDPTQGTGGRNNGGDPTHYNTVTDDGTLALKLQGHVQYLDYNGGAGPKLQPYTLFENGDPASGSFTGSILFDVVDGIWKDYYDTDSQYAGNAGDWADFTFSFSTFSGPGVGDWIIGDTSNAVGNVIPEPATLFLLGSGLMGMGWFGRRKQKKNYI